MEIWSTFRFTISNGLLLVVTAAVGAAFCAEIVDRGPGIAAVGMQPPDPAVLLTLGIALTAIALGAFKGHTINQVFLQATVAYLGCLTFVWIAEAGFTRALYYWLQTTFALTVVIPLVARRLINQRLPRESHQRTWWKKNCEAIALSFLNIILVIGGLWLQVLNVAIGDLVFQ